MLASLILGLLACFRFDLTQRGFGFPDALELFCLHLAQNIYLSVGPLYGLGSLSCFLFRAVAESLEPGQSLFFLLSPSRPFPLLRSNSFFSEETIFLSSTIYFFLNLDANLRVWLRMVLL